METWLLIVIIVVSLAVVGVVVMMMMGGDEEEKKAVAPPHKVIDLDDEKQLATLSEKHLDVYVDHPITLTVKDKETEGFAWIIHEESGCADVLKIEKADGPSTY